MQDVEKQTNRVNDYQPGALWLYPRIHQTLCESSDVEKRDRQEAEAKAEKYCTHYMRQLGETCRWKHTTAKKQKYFIKFSK